MTLLQGIFLGITQAITEFLPISSTGHLHLFQKFFGLQTSLTFDIFLNTATWLSVLFFFRKQVPYFFKNLNFIIVGSLPAVLVGVLFKDQVEAIFASTATLPYEFLFTAVILFLTRYFKFKNDQLTYPKAIIIGLFQALAIIPAISRSGSTIFAGLLLGLSAQTAFNFSFCLFIPASLGALILDAKDVFSLSLLTPTNLIVFGVTFLVGILSLKILQKILISQKFYLFSIYLLVLASILLLVK